MSRRSSMAFDAIALLRSTASMGLLDRNKRKLPAAASATPSNAGAAPLASGPDSDSLRDMLIAAVSANDTKLVNTLTVANREAIAANFAQWQRVPDAVRENGGAMQRYARTLIMLAEIFRDRFADPSLATLLGGSGTQSAAGPDPMIAQWEAALGQADALVKDLKFDEAKDLLGQVLAALADVPMDGPPFHAVTHGRLAHVLFSKGEADAAAEHMRRALELSERRGDEQGAAAGLRGMYEIERYLGKFAEAADDADRLSAAFAKAGNTADEKWWSRQAARVRAGEPLCRVVFFVQDQQYEVEDVPRLNESRMRYGFVRNRAPLGMCEALVQRAMQIGSEAKFDEAMRLFGQAAAIDPYDPSPHHQAAITLMHLQRPAEAVAAYDAVEARAPGWFNSRSDRWLAAEIAAKKIEPPVFFILRTEEMPDTAATWEQKLSLADQAIERAGELAPLMLYRGRCLMRIGRANEAEPVLRKGLENAQEADVRNRLLVDLQMVLPDGEEKRRLLNEAVSLNGNLAAAAVARVTLKQMEM
ncbi:MAG TPA: tetratricopeptide repeat protein [Tepidisphaeraceae bacterium]|nr:tetratricopeptide repeat protein [Tepidisphaeraceae bacterium]